MVERAKADPNEDEDARKMRLASIEDMLVKGEEVIVQARIHWAIYWRAAAVLILSVLVGGFIVKELGYLLLVTSLAMFIHAWLKKSILLLVVTNKRILVRYGILQVDVVDMHFDKTESIELERMIPGYLLGYANVVLMGTGNRYVVVPYVENAVEIRRTYNKIVLSDDEEKGKDGPSKADSSDEDKKD